jgi:hypothetical protein
MSPTKSPKGKDSSKETKKAPGAPKRFKSSYILFFMHVQKKIKEELPPGSHTAPVVSKKASAMWRKLSATERQHWDNQAEMEKKRYLAEKETYKGPWEVPNKRAKKDPTAPRRNPSAFLLYSKKKRQEIKKENPHLKTTEISRMLGQLWKKLPEEDKLPFQKKEALERIQYKKKMDIWKQEQEALKEKAATAAAAAASATVTDETGDTTESEEDSKDDVLGSDLEDDNDDEVELLTGKEIFNTKDGIKEFPWGNSPRGDSPDKISSANINSRTQVQSEENWWSDPFDEAPVFEYHRSTHTMYGNPPNHKHLSYHPQSAHIFPQPQMSEKYNSLPSYPLEQRISPLPIRQKNNREENCFLPPPRFTNSAPIWNQRVNTQPPITQSQNCESESTKPSDQKLLSLERDTKPTTYFQHNPDLACSPIGSYDEFDPVPMKHLS